MHYWIFVMNGTPEDFEKRIETGKWPIYNKTHHRNELSSGDKIVFYLAGKPNKKLMGTAVLSSSLKKDEDYDYSIGMSDVMVWKNPKQMKVLVNKLDFIKNKDNWGINLQGGVIPLPKNDYGTITKSE